MNETAATNDKFRSSVPFVAILVPNGLDTFSPLLGMTDVIKALVMDYQFPDEDKSDRTKGVVELECLNNSKLRIAWEIRTGGRMRDSSEYASGYHCIHSHSDLFHARTESGKPYNLPELQEVYDTHDLVVYLPNVKVIVVD